MESTTGTPQVAASTAPAAPAMASGGTMPTPQAAVTAAHGTSPQMTMNTAEMAEGGETSSEHKTEWGQWIAIGLISLTLVSLILQIAVHRRNLKKVDADDEALRKDVRELKMNLKKQMGDKYEALD